MAEQHAVAVEEEIRVVRSGVSPDRHRLRRAGRADAAPRRDARPSRSAPRRTARRPRSPNGRSAKPNDTATTSDNGSSPSPRAPRNRPPAARPSCRNARTSCEQRLAGHGRRRTRCTVGGRARRRRPPAKRAKPTSRNSADRAAGELGRAREQVERELARLRELQGAARAELARMAAVIRAELPPTRRPSPRPTRRADSATGGGARRPGRSANPRGGAADATTTPYRFATAGR